MYPHPTQELKKVFIKKIFPRAKKVLGQYFKEKVKSSIFCIVDITVKLFIAKNKQNKTKQKHWNSPHSNLQ
jgi:hypothetical protein